MSNSPGNRPLVISIASGKGGVGKTTVALALAYELGTAQNNVVILDFDFYNRGMLELARTYGQVTQSSLHFEPTSLPKNVFETCNWPLVSLGTNVLTVKIPRLGPYSLRSIESCELNEIQEFVLTVINMVTEKSAADIVIIDCHGGRDSLSFAAASISDHLLVVSAPELTTFFGTIQFIEGLRDEIPHTPNGPRFHILANAVMDEFPKRILSHWYRKHFSAYFYDSDFISVIPFDKRISMSSSEGLFPTRKYHYSSMAERMRILVTDLFGTNGNIRISPEARFSTKFVRPFIGLRESIMGLILNVRIPLHALIGTASLMFFVVVGTQLEWNWIKSLDANEVVGTAISFSFVWLAATFISSAMLEQDSLASSGSGRLNWKALGKMGYDTLYVVAGLAFFWFAAIVSFDMAGNVIPEWREVEFKDHVRLFLLRSVQVLVGFVSVSFVLAFIVRGVRAFRFRRRSQEFIYRALVIGASSVLWYILFDQIH